MRVTDNDANDLVNMGETDYSGTQNINVRQSMNSPDIFKSKNSMMYQALLLEDQSEYPETNKILPSK